ncbi:uncharacterized protein LOC117182662 [Belonocnema kinseyi]|uniref:uncharacterized protein LOC117182662 n=1 Tax=Belonocnema kinseyi TaxID=2817044 RepID=UPI00143DCF46|nr:uncharacterized protein LOC117182662 [Belonocnema kinseyi]
MKLPSSSQKARAQCNLITNQQLHNEIQRFWEIEDYVIKGRYPQLDPANICEQNFVATTERDSQGRFIVAMPLKEEVSELSESFNMAYKRFLYMERKLKKDSDLKDKYVEFIADYARQGYMELISQEEVETGKLVNYLPHHAVTKESSTTTNLRVLFDGSARTSSGLSLNELQRIGYVVQNDLFSITLRFR